MDQPFNIWEINGGVYLGYGAQDTKGKAPDPSSSVEFTYDDDRHIITFGPNGSGKTRRLLIPNLLRLRDWSMLVIDPKGELARITSEERRKYGNVIYLDPYKISGFESDGFNPILALDSTSGEFADDALTLADAIIKTNPNAREPHWEQSAQDLVAALILYARLRIPEVREDGELEYFDNLAYVRSVLGGTTSDLKDSVAAMLKLAHETGHEELAIKAARYADIQPENRELGSILSTALTQTRWLDSKPIKEDLKKGVFDFAVLKQKPTTVYLILPAKRLATQSPWLRLIVAAAMQKLMDNSVKAKVPTLLMLEEMAQLGHLKVMEDNIALMRGYSVKMWGVFQDLSQLQDIYKDRWESFLSNCGVVHSFAPQDLTTAQYLSDRSGIDTVIRDATSVQHGPPGKEKEQSNLNINFSWHERPVIYPQTLREMRDGFMVGYSHHYDGVIRHFAPMYMNTDEWGSFAVLDPSDWRYVGEPSADTAPGRDGSPVWVPVSLGWDVPD